MQCHNDKTQFKKMSADVPNGSMSRSCDILIFIIFQQRKISLLHWTAEVLKGAENGLNQILARSATQEAATVFWQNI